MQILTWINSERKMGHALRNENDYLLPHPRNESLKKIPIFSLLAAWNAGGNLRFYHNRITFKVAQKEQLLAEPDRDIDRID